MIPYRQCAVSTIVGVALLLLGGCASPDRPDEVPISAAPVDESKETVYWTATEDGKIYVVDDDRKQLLYSGEVRRGQTIQVDARANKVMLDNATVTQRDLINDHRYKVYFERETQPPSAAMQQPPYQPMQQQQPAAAQQQTVITADPNARTTVTTDPNAAQPARTTITTDPNAPKATIQTAPDSKTTVTTPDATITTDPNAKQTTVQPK
jgi:hypothetical protein